MPGFNVCPDLVTFVPRSCGFPLAGIWQVQVPRSGDGYLRWRRGCLPNRCFHAVRNTMFDTSSNFWVVKPHEMMLFHPYTMHPVNQSTSQIDTPVPMISTQSAQGPINRHARALDLSLCGLDLQVQLALARVGLASGRLTVIAEARDALHQQISTGWSSLANLLVSGIFPRHLFILDVLPALSLYEHLLEVCTFFLLESILPPASTILQDCARVGPLKRSTS
jgi:hypothetical protein